MVSLLNKYEEITYGKLKVLLDEYNAHVFPKVRIADVLPIKESGISNDLFKFALQAHFDFIICNSDYIRLFAVEFDGKFHTQSDVQKIRDEKKNLICDLFSLPLLRIKASYLDKKYRDLDLLTYFVDVWFLDEAFAKAQEEGHIPWDESFDPTFIGLLNGRTSKSFPYWLSLDLQKEIKKLYDSKSIFDPCASHWIGIDSRGNYRCLAWLQAANSGFLIAQTGMRQQRFPVDISDLVSQLSIFDLYERITAFQNGSRRLYRLDKLEELLLKFKTSFRMTSFAGHSRYNV
jgi:Protein of unknown function (DUF2726)